MKDDLCKLQNNDRLQQSLAAGAGLLYQGHENHNTANESKLQRKFQHQHRRKIFLLPCADKALWNHALRAENTKLMSPSQRRAFDEEFERELNAEAISKMRTADAKQVSVEADLKPVKTERTGRKRWRTIDDVFEPAPRAQTTKRRKPYVLPQQFKVEPQLGAKAAPIEVPSTPPPSPPPNYDWIWSTPELKELKQHRYQNVKMPFGRKH